MTLQSFRDYQQWANGLCNKDLDNDTALAVAALGLSGESGEFADSIKKHLGQGHDLDIAMLRNELGDIMWYVAYAAMLLDVDLQSIINDNHRKLTDRYGDKFSIDKSRNRPDTQALDGLPRLDMCAVPDCSNPASFKRENANGAADYVCKDHRPEICKHDH